MSGIEAEGRLVVARGSGRGNDLTVRVSLWSDEHVIKLASGDGCTTLGIYENPLDCAL